MRTGKIIPYSRQSIDAADIASVVNVLRSDWITQGPQIPAFERDLCKATGARFAVAVSSGTAALHIACRAAGVSSGDEVITSPITFVASANCALYCGARPVFADIQPDTVNIDPQQIARAFTRRTKAVIPVHFGGHPCDLDAISALCRRQKAAIIEDAAHALGASYRGTPIGSCAYSDMTIFSFHPVKTIATGEGGAVTTNSRRLYEKLLLLRNHGITKERLRRRSPGEWYYEMQELGYHYRMTDIQAALGRSQLKKLDSFIARRRGIAKTYLKKFAGNPWFDLPVEKSFVKSAYHLFPLRLKGHCAQRREEIFKRLRIAGLGVQVHYIPVYLQPYYRRVLAFRKAMCPVAEDYYHRAVSIPLYPGMKENEIARVIHTIRSLLGDSSLLKKG